MEPTIITRRVGFRRSLIHWFRREARSFSWRGTRDPYRVWVSEIILQQTRAEQGTPYIERFLRDFPTVHDLAEARLDDALKLWEGLGYYGRARRLHRAAQMIVAKRGGVFPDNASEWERLPGVGRYTAGAIASIAYDEPAPAVDGNVKRVLSRLMDLDVDIDERAASEGLWSVMAELARGRAPGDFNQGMMELGAEVCRPRNPRCDACPVCRYCQAFEAGTQEERPVRRKKRATPHHEVVIAVIKKRGRYLLGKRPPDGLLGGLWEFPGGKVRSGESHANALRREIREELGIRVKVGDLVSTVNHAYTHFRVTLNVYRCEHTQGSPTARTHTQLKWAPRNEFDALTFPKANHKFMHLL